MATFYRKLFKSFQNVSYSLDSQGNFIKPRNGYQELIKSCQGIESLSDQDNVLKKLETETTFLIPTVQLGSLNVISYYLL